MDAVTLSPKQEEGSGSDDAGIMSNANSKAETQSASQNFAYPRRTARKSRASEVRFWKFDSNMINGLF